MDNYDVITKALRNKFISEFDKMKAEAPHRDEQSLVINVLIIMMSDLIKLNDLKIQE